MSPEDGARLLAFRVIVADRDEESAGAILWELGTEGIEVRAGASGEVTLLAYFSQRAGLADELPGAIAAIPGARIELATVPQVDWVARFRESFRAFEVGGFLVAPPWDLPLEARGERLLLVDPGRAFGTGTHESTRLCLRALQEIAAERSLGRVVDPGAGSGILAVAAALLGAASVTAVDLDGEAVDSARTHATLNRVPLHLLQGDGGRAFLPGRFDVLLANLSAALLRERRDEIAALAAPRAAAVLSGFLVEDCAALATSYQRVGRVVVRAEGEWAALVVEVARP